MEQQAEKQKMMTFDLYNANRNMVHVNPLESEFKTHSGSVPFETNDEFNYSKLIRFNFYRINDYIDFIMRPFYMEGKKINISSYFSSYQYQNNILDIPVGSELSSLDLKVPLGFMEHCEVSFFEGVSENKLHEQGNYVVVENTSRNSVNVDLLALFQGIVHSENTKILNNNFNENKKEFELIRIITKNTSQVSIPLINKSEQGEYKIEPMLFFSPMQFQSGVVDIKSNINLNNIIQLLVEIQPRTKVMYHLV